MIFLTESLWISLVAQMCISIWWAFLFFSFLVFFLCSLSHDESMFHPLSNSLQQLLFLIGVLYQKHKRQWQASWSSVRFFGSPNAYSSVNLTMGNAVLTTQQNIQLWSNVGEPHAPVLCDKSFCTKYTVICNGHSWASRLLLVLYTYSAIIKSTAPYPQLFLWHDECM